MRITPTLLEGVFFLVSVVASGLIGYGVDELLGPNFKAKIRYRARQIRKGNRNKELDVEMTTRFDLEEPTPLSEFSETLSRSLSLLEDNSDRIEGTTSSFDGDRQSLIINTKRNDLKIDFHINAQPGGHHSGTQSQKRIATSVVVTPQIRVKYNHLRWGLELSGERIDRFKNRMPFAMEQSENYSVSCQLQTPTEIERFLAKLEVDQLQVENEQIEAYFDGGSVQVRNLSSGDRPDVYDKLQDLIIYYG